jgi:hypothetical protein
MRCPLPMVAAATLFLFSAARSQCPNGAPPNTSQNNTGQPAYWAPGTNVTVYVNATDFPSSAERSAITTAFSNWQNGVTNSNIGYTIVQASGTLPPAGHPANFVVVQRGAIPGGPDQVGLNAYTIAPGTTNIISAFITIDPSVAAGFLLPLMVHEIGHNYGLGDCTACTNSVMLSPIPANSPTAPTDCDKQNIYDYTNHGYGAPGPQPTPTPTPPPTCTGSPSLVCPAGANMVCNQYGMWACSDGSPGCYVPPPALVCPSGATLVCTASGAWRCSDGSPGCSTPPPNWVYQECTTGGHCTNTGQWACNPTSPIVIDTRDEGFHLTDAAHGVRFSFLPEGPSVQTSWTDPAFHNGFLVLDRNGDGVITDGTELFGNLTPQPPSATPNGFLALAVFDELANGGNGNGFIDRGDAVYGKLRVWVDANHNGITEPGELHTLRELGIVRIGLTYRLAKYVDQFGNRFRYVARIWDMDGKPHDVCYDVFLKTSQ